MRERIFAIFTAKLYRALSKRDTGLGDLASNIIFYRVLSADDSGDLTKHLRMALFG